MCNLKISPTFSFSYEKLLLTDDELKKTQKERSNADGELTTV